MTGSDWLEELEKRGADASTGAAIRLAGSDVDYTTLAHHAREMVASLARAGVEAGDVVAVLAPPSEAGVALIHALLTSEIVLLPLNARLVERELVLALESSHARDLVVAAGNEAEGEVLCDSAGCGLMVLNSNTSANDAGALTRLREPARASEARLVAARGRRRAERAALILRTSGTTGQAKGAVIGFDQLVASATGSAALLGSHPEDRWLLCMPLFHIGGLSILIRAALVGASITLHARFDPEAVVRTIEEEAITHVSFVATMLEGVLACRGSAIAPSSLRLVLLGGGPAPEDLLRRAHEAGYPIAPTYGLTEAASQVATRPPTVPISAQAELSGGLVPLPGLEVRLGQGGEVEVRGPVVMRGYLDDADATAEAIQDGWLRTGDVGELDAKGRLRILDRRSDLIVSGGENVYPAEIESVLSAHECVQEVGIIGIEDDRFGRRPLALIVPRPGFGINSESLAAFSRARMADYKCPVDFVEWSVLPRTATGKLRRRDLADEYQRRVRRDDA